MGLTSKLNEWLEEEAAAERGSWVARLICPWARRTGLPPAVFYLAMVAAAAGLSEAVPGWLPCCWGRWTRRWA